MRARRPYRRLFGCAALSAFLITGAVLPAGALEQFEFLTPAADDTLRDDLRSASLLLRLHEDGRGDAAEILAAAREDYARLTGALYAEGYYGGVIHITLDGAEASEIAPLDVPDRIAAAVIRVDPGPRFHFGAARMRPYAKGTKLPPDYRDTRPAYSTAIAEAAEAGVDGWRAIGHAKARVSGEEIVADHDSRTLDALILLEPGPKLRFGRLSIDGQERMRTDRMYEIAGFPEGEVFDPEALQRVVTRLRRTDVFRAVSATEADQPNPDGTLDVAISVAEDLPRRFGFGAELSSSEGIALSGFWLHRNLFGGAERLRFDGEVENIAGDTNATGYRLAARFERPATFTPDTSFFVTAEAERYNLVDLTIDGYAVGAGFSHIFSPELSGEASLEYAYARSDVLGITSEFKQLALPVSIEWDRRDSKLDATSGFYLNAGTTPFLGFGTTGSGAQIKADARIYRGFGTDDRVVLAGRGQIGAVLGPSLAETPPDYLFFSGGGGTVRGQPYQSLGVTQTVGPDTYETGGQSFAALSAEIRARVNETFSVVGFYDAGFVGAEGFDDGQWHSGAGLGVRYNTGLGPIRFDVALPVSGDTGDGVQLYIGIGQAF
ncbi:autotransporter assembly complex protein TamA [Defluviimonas sp. WL0002]|uniref:Autotransporter assembly complex protein TamA n=1 Tax=Albidovulum marisflavi TaxID=2984159 RepID=A0ABT2Z810_9RHOB|nr:autotransporter assembly complex family protein [Defluviimonas sp. WL0002]MCV2867283.1 autotransporter assembly complex protein TamA [Defluviimonas sp. WL0002]